MIDFGNNQLEKHIKYKKLYKKNILFWGLGIENELYLEFENKKKITVTKFINNHKRERYSVDYYKNYNDEFLKVAFLFTIKYSGEEVLNCPILINAHSFTKTDLNNNSKTLYTRNAEPNPKFSGETLIEFLINNAGIGEMSIGPIPAESEETKFWRDSSEYVKNTIDNQWVFDGDTIEFITVNFFNTTLNSICNELLKNKEDFVENLQSLQNKHNLFLEHGAINLMKKNHPFAIHMTNINNVAMFNNGTLHYNITLPTELDKDGLIKDKEKFKSDHCNAIKIIQWLEPLLIAVYGSPDPFALLDNFSESYRFSYSSQRCAISRYIGVGTYDSDLMTTGKILTVPTNELTCSKTDYWWFDRYYKFCAYTKLENVGLDINYNKHYNHGIEIRFLDHITDDKLIYESFEFIILLMDFVLENENVLSNPILDKTWNNIVLKCISNGIKSDLSSAEIKIYEDLFSIKILEKNVVMVYYKIFSELRKRYIKIYKLIDPDSLDPPGFGRCQSNESRRDYLLKPEGKFSSLTINSKIVSKNEYKEYVGIREEISSELCSEEFRWDWPFQSLIDFSLEKSPGLGRCLSDQSQRNSEEETLDAGIEEISIGSIPVEFGKTSFWRNSESQQNPKKFCFGKISCIDFLSNRLCKFFRNKNKI